MASGYRIDPEPDVMVNAAVIGVTCLDKERKGMFKPKGEDSREVIALEERQPTLNE